jgi:hypothetical protein
MVLSRNIRETLRPVFSCKNLISHKEKSTRLAKLKRNPPPHCIAQKGSAFGAEGASASMADRAVRAARFCFYLFRFLARARLARFFTSSSLNIVPLHCFAPQ